jgi:hypothetical protein
MAGEDGLLEAVVLHLVGELLARLLGVHQHINVTPLSSSWLDGSELKSTAVIRVGLGSLAAGWRPSGDGMYGSYACGSVLNPEWSYGIVALKSLA